jgi:general secretion pathway protein F
MADFAYRAATAAGELIDGHIDASDQDAALRQLRSRGLLPIRLTDRAGTRSSSPAAAPAAKETGAGALRFGRRGRPDRQDIHNFTGELAVMLRAGLPLDRALRVQIGMATKPAFRELVEDILRSVKGGGSFSQALAPYRSLFGDFYINMARSGEVGGHLSEVLTRLAEHLERSKSLRESVISALIYPAILVLVAVISVVLMLGFVVPQFEALFADLGEALPTPTRIIVAAGHLIADWGIVLGVGVVLLGFGLAKWLRSDAGRLWRDRAALRLPVLGKVVRKYEITRFARSLGTLLGNGVPIVNAIRIATDTLGNSQVHAAMDGVEPAIKQGGRVAEALEQTRFFSPLALNMVRLGEETGQLDVMLLELARVYDNEVQAGVKRALTMLEPLLILVLGAVIAGIILSILMGILAVNDLAL